MNKNFLIYSTIILNLIVLGGCASTTKVTQLSAEIQNLNKKIDKIGENINIISSELKQTKSESDRANKRLDNQIYLYRK